VGKPIKVFKARQTEEQVHDGGALVTDDIADGQVRGALVVSRAGLRLPVTLR
jgi:hypothetical protein